MAIERLNHFSHHFHRTKEMHNFTHQPACSYMLSLSHISTTHGKFDLITGVILFILAIFANLLLVYGMAKTKDVKNNTSK